MLHLARAIVGGVALLIAVRQAGGGTRVDAGKLVHKYRVFGSAVEEDNEHDRREAAGERDFVLVHGGWREPVKDALPCIR